MSTDTLLYSKVDELASVRGGVCDAPGILLTYSMFELIELIEAMASAKLPEKPGFPLSHQELERLRELLTLAGTSGMLIQKTVDDLPSPEFLQSSKDRITAIQRADDAFKPLDGVTLMTSLMEMFHFLKSLKDNSSTHLWNLPLSLEEHGELSELVEILGGIVLISARAELAAS